MCELAHNINGEPFDPHEAAENWLLFKMKQRGAPELAYDENGLPHLIPIDATREMLRNAVTEPGRYRLNPVDARGRRIDGAQPAYVVVPAKPQAESSALVAAPPEQKSVVTEALRYNTELARAVIDRFPEMMHAAAELLRAADGAGLPARVALPATTPNPDDNDSDGDDDDAEPSAATSATSAFGIDLNRIIGDVANNVIDKLFANGIPSFADMADWGDTRKPKALPSADAAPTTTASAAMTTAPTSTAPVPIPAETPRLDADQMRKMLAIYTTLSSTEAKLAQQLAQELTPAERVAWIAELSALSVPDAVAKLRTLLGGDAVNGVAS